jgi:hypothetical protein
MIAVWLALVWLVLLPSAAGAHTGAHGGAAAISLGAVILGGYRIELVSHAGPLARGAPNRLAARITDADQGTPVTGATVALALATVGGESAPLPAEEETWAGHYAVSVTPDRRGAHRVRVTVEGRPGHQAAGPLVAEFAVDVHRPAGLGPWVWGLLGLLGIGVAVFLGGLAVRMRYARGRPGPLDLLEVPAVRRLLTSRGWTRALLVPVFGLMALVVVLGFADTADGSRNLASRLTWTLWWAGIIFTFVLVGRVWCVACPFGALNEWSARLAGSLRRLPRPFRNIWWATALFALLTWADEQLGVVRSPRATAWLVLLLAAAAIAVGLFFERRSFCRHLCPIGGLIGVYSMVAPVELRAKEASVCRTDQAKGCYRGAAGAAGCPMFEFPATMDRNTYCTLCGECLRGCSHGNLALRVRAFGTDLWASGRRALDEAYLAVVLAGLTVLVTAQMLPGWDGLVAAAARGLPGAVREHLRPVTYLGLVESVLLLGGGLVIAPLLFLGAAALAERRAGVARVGVRRAATTFAYMFIPVGLGLHLAHNLGHLLGEGGGLVAATQRAVALYTPWSLGQPAWDDLALAPASVVLLLQVSVVVVLFAFSLLAGHRLALRLYADPAVALRALVPMVLLALLLTGVGLGLLAQPMELRHAM